jgi:hypothetical protein
MIHDLDMNKLDEIFKDKLGPSVYCINPDDNTHQHDQYGNHDHDNVDDNARENFPRMRQ